MGYKRIFVQNVGYYPLLYNPLHFPSTYFPIRQSSTVPPVCLYSKIQSVLLRKAQSNTFSVFSLDNDECSASHCFTASCVLVLLLFILRLLLFLLLYSFTFLLLPSNYRPQIVQLPFQPPFSHKVFAQTHSE